MQQTIDKLVTTHPEILFVFVAIALLLVLIVPVFFMVAFYQGRSISFWPLKIGEKPSQLPLSNPNHDKNVSDGHIERNEAEINEKTVVFDIGKGFSLSDGINGLKVKVLKCHSNIKESIEPIYVLEFSLLNEVDQEIFKLESMLKSHPEKEHELYQKTKFKLEIVEKHKQLKKAIDFLFFNNDFRCSMMVPGYNFDERMEADCISGFVDIQNYSARFGQKNTWFLINEINTNIFTTMELSDEEIEYMESGRYHDDYPSLGERRRQGLDEYRAYSIQFFSPSIFGKRVLAYLLLLISSLNREDLKSEQYASLCNIKNWYFSKSPPSKISEFYKKS
jgi:hypothetical protein